jgi:hypothetical protein
MLFIGAFAAVVDVSIEFEGETEAVFTATAASASSQVDGSTSRLLFFTAKPAELSSDSQKFQVIYGAPTTVHKEYNLRRIFDVKKAKQKKSCKWESTAAINCPNAM